MPEATETISYKIPAFKLGRVFFYYAAFKQHNRHLSARQERQEVDKGFARVREREGQPQVPAGSADSLRSDRTHRGGTVETIRKCPDSLISTDSRGIRWPNPDFRVIC